MDVKPNTHSQMNIKKNTTERIGNMLTVPLQATSGRTNLKLIFMKDRIWLSLQHTEVVVTSYS